MLHISRGVIERGLVLNKVCVVSLDPISCGPKGVCANVHVRACMCVTSASGVRSKCSVEVQPAHVLFGQVWPLAFCLSVLRPITEIFLPGSEMAGRAAPRS